MSGHDLIEIKLSKCLLAITEEELYFMLKQNPSIWQAGIKRGKSIKRAEKVEKWRQSKKEINITMQ
jgi:hypothetical protein